METKVQVACLFAGIVDHWHEGIIYPDGTRSLYKCSCMEHQSTEPLSRLNPDPLHNDGDYWRLVKGMMEHEGWDSFCDWCMPKWVQSDKYFTPWILLSPERFITLVWDWLGQEDVQEEYGWVECPKCNGRGDLTYIRDGLADVATCECAGCNGSGHLPAPWLEERRPNETDSFQTDRRGEKGRTGRMV